MKMTLHSNDRTLPNQRNDLPSVSRLKYEAPVLARMELASVIAGVAGSQLDNLQPGRRPA